MLLRQTCENMSVANSKAFLELLAESKPKRRKQLLNTISPTEVKALCEICLNITNGNLPVDNKAYNRLKRKKSVVRELGSEGSLKRKKAIINQEGGFLGSLAAIALPLIATLFSK